MNKAKFLPTALILGKLGYKIFATDSTAQFFKDNGMQCEPVRKAFEASPNVLNIVENKKVAFVVNLSTEDNKTGDEEAERYITDGFRIRRATVDNQIPLFTDLHLARSFIRALEKYKIEDLEVKSYKEYL